MSVGRAVLTTTVLVFLYFVVPVSNAPGTTGAALLAFGLLAFIAVLTWQIRSVMRSRTPQLRAIEVLGTAAPFFLLLFAMSYYVLGHRDGSAFSEPLSRLDALYFTLTVFATVGFGDIVARTETARSLVTVQMFGDLIVIGVGFRLLLGAVRVGLSRRDETQDVPAGDLDGSVPPPAPTPPPAPARGRSR